MKEKLRICMNITFSFEMVNLVRFMLLKFVGIKILIRSMSLGIKS